VRLKTYAVNTAAGKEGEIVTTAADGQRASRGSAGC
jgi:hypothetical protein